MAKGKKTAIKEIKRLNKNEVLVNSRTYVIVEDTPDIEKAITMKITSHGNRILRFEDLSKKATIDVKRTINILKYTFKDAHRAKRFRISFEKSILTNEDKFEIVAIATSYINARQIIASYVTKDTPNYDRESQTTTVYVSQEEK
ncbi:MAG: hypothetical protein K8R39_10450 [Arcobacteraceae bacterium]|nr:hypothetical protein [Arcobacteraceae bacterium]